MHFHVFKRAIIVTVEKQQQRWVNSILIGVEYQVTIPQKARI